MANYTVVTNALKERLLPSNLWHYDLIHAQVIVFAFGSDEFSGTLTATEL